MLKLKKLSLLLCTVAAFMFTACEADFPMGEFDEQLRGPKKRSEIACTVEEGQEARFGCQMIGGDCRDYVSCGKALIMSPKEYREYRKENF